MQRDGTLFDRIEEDSDQLEDVSGYNRENQDEEQAGEMREDPSSNGLQWLEQIVDDRKRPTTSPGEETQNKVEIEVESQDHEDCARGPEGPTSCFLDSFETDHFERLGLD